MAMRKNGDAGQSVKGIVGALSACKFVYVERTYGS